MVVKYFEKQKNNTLLSVLELVIKVNHLCFITMAKQYAFGLKSEPRATAIPFSIICRTGGGFRRRIYAVVGNTTPTEPEVAIAVIPASEISSK